jgi:hypothetical protein
MGWPVSSVGCTAGDALRHAAQLVACSSNISQNLASCFTVTACNSSPAHVLFGIRAWCHSPDRYCQDLDQSSVPPLRSPRIARPGAGAITDAVPSLRRRLPHD